MDDAPLDADGIALIREIARAADGRADDRSRRVSLRQGVRWRTGPLPAGGSLGAALDLPGNRGLLASLGIEAARSAEGRWSIVHDGVAPDEWRRIAALAAEIARAGAPDGPPVPDGERLRPYQAEGVAVIAGRPSVLLADEMGLGKSAQVIAAMNTEAPARSVVVCPANVRYNWAAEIARWNTRAVRAQVVVGGPDRIDDDAGIVVIGYEGAVKHAAALAAYGADWAVFDEAHYLKNPDAKRTRALLGSDGPFARAAKRVMLTGTPVVNRPDELWPLLHWLQPGAWGTRRAFERRYCDIFGGPRAATLPELRRRLAGAMVRRLKRDVMADLPDVAHRTWIARSRGIGHEERELARWMVESGAPGGAGGERAAAGRLAELRGSPGDYRLGFGALAALRHAASLRKVPATVSVVRHVVGTAAPDRLVVFGHHRAALDLLAANAPPGFAALRFSGDMAPDAKRRALAAFQSDASGPAVLYASTRASGLGISLARASACVFHELQWTPAEMDQAVGRLHRHGQRGSVDAIYVVEDGTLDVFMAAAPRSCGPPPAAAR